MKEIVTRIILIHRCHPAHKDRRLRGIMQLVSRHSPIKMMLVDRPRLVRCREFPLDGWRKRRLHMRDSIEGIYASRLEAILTFRP
jgi:putative component of membrane protein insertase Oxa1/YidC/SpoIIIJ protein YidD